jgi:hypothetical protein
MLLFQKERNEEVSPKLYRNSLTLGSITGSLNTKGRMISPRLFQNEGNIRCPQAFSKRKEWECLSEALPEQPDHGVPPRLVQNERNESVDLEQNRFLTITCIIKNIIITLSPCY